MAKRTYEHPGFEYKKVNVSLEPKQDPKNPVEKATIESAANRWADLGWETVAVMQISSMDRQLGFSDSILVKRVKANPYSQTESAESFGKWSEWDNRYGGPWTHRIRTHD